jgi:arginyl-tRNA synthetase
VKIEEILSQSIINALKTLYTADFDKSAVVFQKTNPDFEGDITLVVFPFLKASKKNPEQTAADIGNYLKSNCADVSNFNVVKGFLNLVIADSYWLNSFIAKETTSQEQKAEIMVEYCSPNTNKPIHLGHVRNILLGWSMAQILEANGHKVIKANLVNDRGIHICKSMLAWQKWGKGETPEKAGIKGDHWVGKYYVMFEQKLLGERSEILESEFAHVQDLNAAEKEEVFNLYSIAKNLDEKEEIKKNAWEKLNELARLHADLSKGVQEMLRKWEAGDEATIALWKKMNGWVYDGFAETFKCIGIRFDKTYYESQTYLLGKKAVEEGLAKNVFIKRPDGSVIIDLKQEKLDEKVLLRSDGTSVYITQDIGTAIERHKEFPNVKGFIYTVGNEQDYHFKVLFKTLKKLGYAWADNCYHLSYGMVELPEGKMKSREGTVVDADELIKEMIDTARETTQALGKIENFTSDEAENLYRMIGLAALKYFILKVDPKKKMLFNPKESIDFNGNTGPFIQYTYARIKSIIRKAETASEQNYSAAHINLDAKEKTLIKLLYHYPALLAQAAKEYNPSVIAAYTYDLATAYNSFYHDIHILKEENRNLKNFRIALSLKVAEQIKQAMQLLGIEVPERM